MKTAKFIWMNGKFKKWKDAKVHFLTHTLHYGTGVFEGIRCYTGSPPAIFRLDEHLKRLEDSAKIFGIKIPFSRPQIKKAIIRTVKKNKLKQCYIRPLVYYGYGAMGLNPKPNPVQLGIAAWPWEHYLGKKAIEQGAKVKVCTWIRNSPDAIPPKAKICGAYANSALGKVEALEEGSIDSILLDDQGFVAEGTGENIFVVKEGVLYTPPLSNCLAGITRKSIIEIAENQRIPLKEKEMSRGELYSADEVFFTGTAAEVTPITIVDNRKVGKGKVGPITKRLQKTYSEIVHGKNDQFSDWLTPIQ
ncbi:branched-chain amino acid transaminase [Candidatus Micrarchaeota archaeon]|nr:branched-chain amino acid transaminase [Candidatus Micrarchaeota archaeon]MBU1930543.1 branched-chain amino acid transaminase [Candidatus Micrarchaeota archaeon]